MLSCPLCYRALGTVVGSALSFEPSDVVGSALSFEPSNMSLLMVARSRLKLAMSYESTVVV